MEKNTSVILGVLLLALGFGLGYFVNDTQSLSADTHEMSSGQVMDNDLMSMSNAMDGMMAGLEGKQSDAFDQAFLQEMIVHHQGAVEMAGAALKSAKHQEIKDLAQKIITAQNAEIKEMQDWQGSWYGAIGQ